MSGVAMEQKDVRRDVPTIEPQYVDGWLTRQFKAGVKPDYGYPKNHLPETDDKPVEMVTGFIAAMGG